MLQTRGRMLASNPQHHPHVSLAAFEPFVPFGVPRRGCRGVRRLRDRVAQAAHGDRSGGVRQAHRRTGTTVRFAGTIRFSTAEATSKTHAAGPVLPFVVPLAGKLVVLAGRRKLGPVRQPGPAARRASCGTVSFHDAEGTRLKTLSFGPETGKTTAPLAAEVAHVRKARPDAGRRRRRRARQPDVSREVPA